MNIWWKKNEERWVKLVIKHALETLAGTEFAEFRRLSERRRKYQRRRFYRRHY